MESIDTSSDTGFSPYIVIVCNTHLLHLFATLLSNYQVALLSQNIISEVKFDTKIISKNRDTHDEILFVIHFY